MKHVKIKTINKCQNNITMFYCSQINAGLTQKIFDIKPNIYCQLFDAFVGSILNYSCETWGYT